MNTLNFLYNFWLYLTFAAIGCPDIVPPRNGRMKRTGNECEIDCPGTNLKWVMTCEENKWVGNTVGKCPGAEFGPAAGPNSQQSESSSFSLPTGKLITVLSGECRKLSHPALKVDFGVEARDSLLDRKLGCNLDPNDCRL